MDKIIEDLKLVIKACHVAKELEADNPDSVYKIAMYRELAITLQNIAYNIAVKIPNNKVSTEQMTRLFRYVKMATGDEEIGISEFNEEENK